MRFRLRPRRAVSQSPELAEAREKALESKRRATEDLERQRQLLQHETQTVTGPLRAERVIVNHLSVLAQIALWGE